MATSHPTTTTSSSMTSTSFFLVFLLYRGVGQKTIFINFLIFFLTGFYWVSIWVSLTHYRVLLGFPYGFLCRVPSFTGFLIDVMGEKTVFTGFYWVSIWISFNYRVLLGFHLDFIRLLGFTGFPFRFRCRLPSFTGFLFGFHSITEFYWVSIWISFNYWVLLGFRLGFIADYRVLLGFFLLQERRQFLPSFTGFPFGFRSITRFNWVNIWVFITDYRVLLGFFFMCRDGKKTSFFTGFYWVFAFGFDILPLSFHYFNSIILLLIFIFSLIGYFFLLFRSPRDERESRRPSTPTTKKSKKPKSKTKAQRWPQK